MLKYSMTVEILTQLHLEFLSLKGDCIGSSESTLIKMPHCWKLRVTAQISNAILKKMSCLEYADILRDILYSGCI